MTELKNYASYHLTSEETAFITFGFPERKEHIKEHDYYREEINKYLKRTYAEKVDIEKLTKEFVDFASSWLKKHILVSDMEYTYFFTDKNLQYLF